MIDIPPSQFHLYREFSIKHSPFHRYFGNPLLAYWEFRCQLLAPKNLSIVIYSNICFLFGLPITKKLNKILKSNVFLGIHNLHLHIQKLKFFLPINPLPRTCFSSFPPTFLCWRFTHCYQETPTKLSMERLPFHCEPIITSAPKIR